MKENKDEQLDITDLFKNKEDEKNEAVDSSDMRGLLKPGTRKQYLLAGRSYITLVSLKTGVRFTYKIAYKVAGTFKAHYVSVLNGPDNTKNYQYLGTIFDSKNFRRTSSTKVAVGAPSFIAFDWFSKNIESKFVEVWHEGKCGRCGKKLTVPKSIENGIGPDCMTKLGKI